VKVVLDTNVVVSGAFFGGLPRAVLDAWAEGRFQVILSPSILDEYMRVCARLRTVYPEADYQAVLTELAAHGELVPDAEEGEPATADRDDDKFMRCALAAGAVVVSGDRHLLDASGWREVRVLAPADFLANLPTSEPGAT
jgi:putative PIN family toxin of toxin-antitoxin system